MIDGKKLIFIKGEKIYLKELTENNVSERYASWLNNNEINRYLETKKTTIEELRGYVKQKSESKECLFFGIFTKEKDLHIGNIKLEPISLENKIATMGMLIGDKEYWGKGIATEALKLLVNWGFNNLKINKIDLGVLKQNVAAIRVYEKAGFNIISEDSKGFKMIIRKDNGKVSKLCLGTVQLGMNYGINNNDGKPSFEESGKIIRTALNNGINVFDTSPKYGDSEKILGEFLHKSEDLIIISKLPPTDWTKCSDEIIKRINNAVTLTLNNLKLKKIPIYLVHKFEDVEKRDGLIINELSKLKKDNKIGKIGTSVYTPFEAEKSLDNEMIEVIQIPFNLVDKRLKENGFLKKAKNKRIMIFVRSVFLQGLFFKKDIPPNLVEFEEYKKRIDKMSKRYNISISELALRYALSIDEIDSVLIGVEKETQLSENINIFNKGKLNYKILKEINSMGNAPEKIINPSLWNIK